MYNIIHSSLFIVTPKSSVCKVAASFIAQSSFKPSFLSASYQTYHMTTHGNLKEQQYQSRSKTVSNKHKVKHSGRSHFTDSKIYLTTTSTFNEEESTTKQQQQHQQQQPEASSNVINGNYTNTEATKNEQQPQSQLVHKAEGLCAVYKPINWTSQDVVAYIRGMLERDARDRGVTLAKRRARKSKKKIKVGHGGTLDPLASGVLVLGIGSGTKILKDYLSGDKEYLAKGKFGFETNTLDLEGNVTKTSSFEHISHDDVILSLNKFMGKTMQVPPIFSAIRQDGKRLYEQARNGVEENDVEIQPREIEISKLEYVPDEQDGLPSFGLSVKCGGGTYIRSLIRDIGYHVNSVATMTGLVRTQQGPFVLKDTLQKDEWSADAIYAAVERNNLEIASMQQDEDDVETG